MWKAVKPEEKRQLLPKDILHHARMFSGQEAKDAIAAAIKNHSLYSHATFSTQWMNPTMGNSSNSWGMFSTMATSTAMPMNYSYSTTSYFTHF